MKRFKLLNILIFIFNSPYISQRTFSNNGASEIMESELSLFDFYERGISQPYRLRPFWAPQLLG